jgi:hypothetical protein
MVGPQSFEPSWTSQLRWFRASQWQAC